MDREEVKKVVLVTGGTKGIGLAIAQQFASCNFDVVVCGRDLDAIRSAQNTVPNCSAIQIDVTKSDQIGLLLEFIESKFRRLDCLVCNVGSGKSVPPGEETEEEWRRVFDLNFFSATATIEKSKHLLSKSMASCISSICGHERILDAPITYSVAKAALNALVSNSSHTLGKQGIRINAVAPGNILFEGSTWETKLKRDKAALSSMLDQEVPLGRLGTPDEIAKAVFYLASTNAAFVTGSIWTIDGGQTRSK